MPLADGMAPRALLRALGFDADLSKYAPDQPRVPAGSGRESGQWRLEDAANIQAVAAVPIIIEENKETPGGITYNIEKIEGHIRCRNFLRSSLVRL